MKTPLSPYNLKDKVWAYMNRHEGDNVKDVNWVKPLQRIDDDHVKFEVGYWITYLNCKPIYKKEIVVISLKEL